MVTDGSSVGGTGPYAHFANKEALFLATAPHAALVAAVFEAALGCPTMPAPPRDG